MSGDGSERGLKKYARRFAAERSRSTERIWPATCSGAAFSAFLGFRFARRDSMDLVQICQACLALGGGAFHGHQIVAPRAGNYMKRREGARRRFHLYILLFVSCIFASSMALSGREGPRKEGGPPCGPRRW